MIIIFFRNYFSNDYYLRLLPQTFDTSNFKLKLLQTGQTRGLINNN